MVSLHEEEEYHVIEEGISAEGISAEGISAEGRYLSEPEKVHVTSEFDIVA